MRAWALVRRRARTRSPRRGWRQTLAGRPRRVRPRRSATAFDRWHGSRRAGSRAGPVASPSRLPTRLELDDGVLRVRDPGVIHPEKLGDERVLDPFEVSEREVAFVELSVGDALVDDPRDHRPDRRLPARLEGSDRRLDAVGEHDQGGFSALWLRTRMAEPPL